jgi:hypothetical protein
MASDGSIYGIELLNLKEQLFANKEFVFYNENTGTKKEVELPT